MENSNISLFFGQHKRLFVHQVKEWGEILFGFETRNKYQISNEAGQVIGFCAEQGKGIWSYIIRYILRNHRTLEVFVWDNQGKLIMKIHRPFYWFFSTLFVSDGNDNSIGQIEQRFAIFRKKYDLFVKSNLRFASINSSFFKFFTFDILDSRDNIIGAIRKKWGGFLKEFLTDADRFGVEFSTELDDVKKAIILANVISIDFDYFEDNANRRGVL